MSNDRRSDSIPSEAQSEPQPVYWPSPMVGEFGEPPDAPPLPLWKWILGMPGIWNPRRY
jgi:hypothetical protein